METRRTNRTLTFSLIAAAVAGLSFWIGCSDQSLLTDVPDSGPAMATTAEILSKASAARARLPEDLLDREGVEGVGTRVAEDGGASIVIYVQSQQAAARANLPEHVEGLPVTVVVTGPFVARSDETSRARPAPIGFSIGHPDITAGTIGARVKDASGNVYILSNNHVLANINEASLGDNSLQPGPYDGGANPDDAIGTLFDFEPIDFSGENTMDAAISLSNPGELDFRTPADEGYGVPGTSVRTASIGMAVQKYGRTTGHTQGEVAEIDVTVDVCYVCANPSCMRCAASARFADQIGVTPGEFSAGGDSGSLIVTDDGQNNPVALLFAGSSARTLANPIGTVLERFGVSIDDGSGAKSNLPPSASFTYSCTDLSCSFDGGGSSDSDGTVATYEWAFGDGNTGSGATASHTYAGAGTYGVTLTVTDDEGATGSESRNVSVGSSSTAISLSASGYKVRGLQKADLTWSGATSSNVDVYRSGSVVATTANDGAFTDDINNRGGGTYVYKVCESGTATCSDETTVSF